MAGGFVLVTIPVIADIRLGSIECLFPVDFLFFFYFARSPLHAIVGVWALRLPWSR